MTEVIMWTTMSEKPNRFLIDDFFIPADPGETFLRFTHKGEQFFVHKDHVVSVTVKEVTNG